jgi:hypothetical protein
MSNPVNLRPQGGRESPLSALALGEIMVNGFHAGFRESGLAGDDGAHGPEGYFLKQTVYVRY